MRLGPTHTFEVVNGLRLHTLDYGGSGRTVLLLHGVLGNAWMWSAVAAALRDRCHVMAPDLRGYGSSQWSAEHNYSTVDHAADVITLAEHRGWERLAVVGFSWGALVGLAAAQARPALVERLVDIDLPPSSDRDESDVPPVPMTVATHADALAAESALAAGITPEMAETMASYGRRPGEGGSLVRAHDPFYARHWPFLSEDWWDALEQFDGPLLVVRGTDSPVCSQEQAWQMVQRACNGRLVEIGPSGHLVPLERPTELAGVLSDFIHEEQA